ncbi:MAG TPA: GNAT family N-acetyltransferase [Steroidobacteraceae bacterium]
MTLTIKPESIESPVVAELILALNAELEERYPEEGANHFRLDPAEVAPGRGVFLVAYADGVAAGCGAVRVNGPGIAEIKRMFVVPAYRGRGIAGQVLAQLEVHARELGVRQLVLETGVRQPESIAVYRRAGFDEIPLFGEYLNSPLTSLCMGKWLAAGGENE